MKTKRERAADPNTPPRVLLQLAEEFPALVLANPVLPLVNLEEPGLGRWITARCRLALAMADLDIGISYLRRQDEDQAIRFGLDCAEHVLPLFEAEEPMPWPRELIRLGRAELEVGPAEGREIRDQIHLVVEDLDTSSISKAAHFACFAARGAVGWSLGSASEACNSAFQARGHAALGKAPYRGNEALYVSAEAEEAVWQVRRLREYIKDV